MAVYCQVKHITQSAEMFAVTVGPFKGRCVAEYFCATIREIDDTSSLEMTLITRNKSEVSQYISPKLFLKLLLAELLSNIPVNVVRL